MDRQTIIYRNKQFDRIVREQGKDRRFNNVKIKFISGNVETNYMDIDINELGAIRKRLCTIQRR